ncbi:hypothetical protein SEPCBS119000_003667 [Sporothrix epigloea]|uniref:BTB domain-containing protein n=1 Tax=Sporothrix epigloea TaxID=1892477 RepID=A0ABP0DMV2_9PEZI
MASATPIANDQDAQATTCIAASGDVVLVVGPSGKKLKVHSLFVVNASPVFNAILGPNFAEGQQLRKSGLAEVILPEDNAKAMEMIMNVVHGLNDKVPELLDPDELVEVAITAEKYDCIGALAFAIRSWLSCKVNITDPGKMWAMAMAALVFRRQKAFAEATSALVLNYAGSYIGDIAKYENVIDPVLLLKTAANMEEARNRLRMRLSTDLLNGDWCRNHYAVKAKQEYVRLISDCGQMSLSSAVKAMDKVCRAGGQDELCSDDEPESVGNINSNLKKIKMRHEKESGLCLRCVQTGEGHQKHA